MTKQGQKNYEPVPITPIIFGLWLDRFSTDILQVAHHCVSLKKNKKTKTKKEMSQISWRLICQTIQKELTVSFTT